MTDDRRRSIVGGLLAGAAVAGAPLARAQAWPDRQVRLVVPFAPGGALDAIARELASSLAQTTGQPVIVDNRPGGNGAVGTVHAARTAPDGLTLLVQAQSFVALPSMMATAPYDPVRDFVAVSNLAHVSQVLLVPPSSPVRTLAELIAAAKASPGRLNYGTGGAGSSGHMATELLMRETGIVMNHVPYKGNAPMLVDLLGGHLQAAFENVPSALAHVRGGRLRPLGTTSAKRSPLLPDVPAIGETVPGYEASTFQAVFVPAGTPRPVVAGIHAAVQRFTDDPANRARFAQNGVDLAGSTSPERFAAHIESEYARWSTLVKQAGIRVE